MLAHGNIKIKLIINFIRLGFAQIPGYTGTAQHGARKPPGQRVASADHTHIHRALLPDAVAVNQRGHIVDHLAETVNKAGDIILHAARNILMNAARANIRRMKPRAGCAFVKLQNFVAFLKEPQQRCGRTNVDNHRADIETMVSDTREFAENNAQIFRTQRHIAAEQFLHRQRIAMLKIHWRNVIQPVKIRHGLQVGLVLNQLFCATVQQADMWIGTLDHFTVHFKHQTQYTMRRRMLRAKIERKVFNVNLASHTLIPSKNRCMI